MDDIVKRLRDQWEATPPDICHAAADRIEALEAALRDVMNAWDFWQSQETRSGFSELFANICEARAALGEKKE